MTISRRTMFSLVVAGMLQSAGIAHAAPPDASDPQVPFDEGRALIKAGRYAEAVPKLEQSLAIKVTGGALLNLGDCLEKLGRYASAVESFDRAREIFAEGGDSRRGDEAKSRAERLRPTISTLRITMETPPSSVMAPDPSTTSLTVDGRPFKAGARTPIDGGEHRVVYSAPCRVAFETTVKVGLHDDAKELALSPLTTPDPSCVSPPPEPTVTPEPPAKIVLPKPEKPSSGTAKTVAIVGGVVGVVALGAGVFFGVRASGLKGDLDAACSSYPRGCPGSRRAEIEGIASDADSAATVSTVGFVVGAVLVAGAVILYATTSRDRPPPRAFVTAQGLRF